MDRLGGEAGSGVEDAGRTAYVRPRQSVLVRFGKRIRDPVNAWFARQSLIATDPVVEAAALPAIQPLSHSWRVIQREAQALLDGQEDIPDFGKISPDHRRIANGPQWKSFFFEGYGFKSAANRSKCPHTAELLDGIPRLVVAFFSIMDGNAHVPRHRGLTKAWLNCHLPLVVPDRPGRCEMQVADRTVHWHEGEWLVFDETYPHEVWNDTGQPRIVLMLQVRRPMRWPGRALARAIYEAIRRTGFVQDVRKAVGA
ncbi:aspartyl/asparaginyl beta-hydroxylase domain-containing protein [Parerythrobacter jejuensis]|uniref:aspartyl/asparaginyl beta-hydroxylase domain-containing protein n=1 Tax=Parerythrobacter jejuensis TaxID=795812 RepID=UPI001368FD72|nr:aspartyl/asparaginyl beta-hydroxylase domain-containing protein [Parerythrobacter jejuensis]